MTADNLFWKKIKVDGILQSLLALWSKSTQEVAEKLQNDIATEKEKAAMLQYLTQLDIVVIDHDNKQLANRSSTDVTGPMMKIEDVNTSNHEGTSVGIEQFSETVATVRSLENILIPSEKQIDVTGLFGEEKAIKGEMIKEEKEGGGIDDEGDCDDDDDDDDDDFKPVNDMHGEGSLVEEESRSDSKNDAVSILLAIQKSLKENCLASEDDILNEAKVEDAAIDDTEQSNICTADTGVPISVLSGTENLTEVWGNNLDDQKPATDIATTEESQEMTSIITFDGPLNGKIMHRRCTICTLIFDDPLLLQRHVESIHNKFRKHVCTICDKRFIRLYSLRKHVPSCKDKVGKCQKIKCTMCLKLFNPNGTKEHVCVKAEASVRVSERPIKRHTCNGCGYLFASAKKLAEHSKVHENVPPVSRSSHSSLSPAGPHLPRVNIKQESVTSGPRLTRSRSYALQLRKFAIVIATRKANQKNPGIGTKKAGQKNDKIKAKRKKKPNQPTMCGLCDRFFSSSSTLRDHVKVIHKKYKPHKCGICGKGFSRPYLLNKHVITHDPNRIIVRKPVVPKKIIFEPKYQCNKCTKTYKFKAAFGKHKCREFAFKFLCKLCGHRSKTESLLKKHDNEFHKKVKSHICDLCGAGFIMKSDLNRHHNIFHNIQSQCACNICGKIFKCEQYLKKHIENRHREPNSETIEELTFHQCEVCGKLFQTKAGLKAHKLIHADKQFNCELCDSKFRRKGGLKTHMESVHQKLRDKLCQLCGKGFYGESTMRNHIDEVHKSVKPHVCDQCGKGFYGRFALTRHLQSHERKQNIQAIPRPTYPCDQCGRVCPNKSVLAIHLVSHNQERNFSCGMCSATFKLQSSLKQHHRRVHLNIRPHSCEKCPKRFTGSSCLRKHMATVHEEGDSTQFRYPCTVCKKKLISKKELESHTKWHNGLHLFKCNHCGKDSFSTATSLRIHMQRHKGDSWRCRECGQGFKNQEQRDRHRKKEHLGDLDWNKCKMCNKEFTTHQSLNRHMHNHRGDSWKCGDCGQKFPTVYAKEKHRKEHHRQARKPQTTDQIDNPKQTSFQPEHTGLQTEQTLLQPQQILCQPQEILFQTVQSLFHPVPPSAQQDEALLQPEHSSFQLI